VFLFELLPKVLSIPGRLILSLHVMLMAVDVVEAILKIIFQLLNLAVFEVFKCALKISAHPNQPFFFYFFWFFENIIHFEPLPLIELIGHRFLIVEKI